jgi:hypothetical protein
MVRSINKWELKVKRIDQTKVVIAVAAALTTYPGATIVVVQEMSNSNT